MVGSQIDDVFQNKTDTLYSYSEIIRKQKQRPGEGRESLLTSLDWYMSIKETIVFSV